MAEFTGYSAYEGGNVCWRWLLSATFEHQGAS